MMEEQYMGKGSSKAGSSRNGGGNTSVVNAIKSAGYGVSGSVKLTRTYPDGTKQYTSAEGFKLSGEEANISIVSMSNTIRRQLSEKLGVSKADVEMEGTTATVYRNASKAERRQINGVVGAKDFYNIDAYAESINIGKHGEVTPAGGHKYKFRLAGSKI